MAKRKHLPPLDAFSRKRMQEDNIGERYSAIRRAAQDAELRLLVGGLVIEFDDSELVLLARTGCLTYGTIDVLVHRGHLTPDWAETA